MFNCLENYVKNVANTSLGNVGDDISAESFP